MLAIALKGWRKRLGISIEDAGRLRGESVGSLKSKQGGQRRVGVSNELATGNIELHGRSTSGRFPAHAVQTCSSPYPVVPRARIGPEMPEGLVKYAANLAKLAYIRLAVFPQQPTRWKASES